MQNPLVSIIVITYNSSKYVLETLESAKVQTYQNVELIISDDGSQDQTVELCDTWLAANKERFVYSQIITVEKNTGIPANCNRGVKASRGDWIKLIAGDDVLELNAIESSVKFTENNNFEILVSKMKVFNEKGEIEKQTENYNKIAIWFTNKSQIAQKKSYIRVPIMLNIPTLFCLKKLILEVSSFDEEIKLLEDQPFLIKILTAGYQIGFNNEITVHYRKHNSGVMQNKNMLFIESLYQSFVKYRKPELKIYNFKDMLFSTYQKITFLLIRNNYDENVISKFFLRINNILVKWS